MEALPLGDKGLPISEVEADDEVMATNAETSESEPREVTAVWEHDDELVDLEVECGTLATTGRWPHGR